MGEKKRAGKESAATAERETGRETESRALTSGAVAKNGVIISVSLAMTIVNMVNAEGVRALSKGHLAAILLLLLCFSSFFFFSFLLPSGLVRHLC